MYDLEVRKMFLNPFTDFGFKKLFSNPKHQGPFIALLDFGIFPEPDPVSWHLTCNLVTKSPSIGTIFMTMVELPKFTKTLEELSSPLDEWLYLMGHIREWDRFPEALQRPPLAEAGEILAKGALTPSEQRVYESVPEVKPRSCLYGAHVQQLFRYT